MVSKVTNGYNSRNQINVSQDILEQNLYCGAQQYSPPYPKNIAYRISSTKVHAMVEEASHLDRSSMKFICLDEICLLFQTVHSFIRIRRFETQNIAPGYRNTIRCRWYYSVGAVYSSTLYIINRHSHRKPLSLFSLCDQFQALHYTSVSGGVC